MRGVRSGWYLWGVRFWEVEIGIGGVSNRDLGLISFTMLLVVIVVVEFGIMGELVGIKMPDSVVSAVCKCMGVAVFVEKTEFSVGIGVCGINNEPIEAS